MKGILGRLAYKDDLMMKFFGHEEVRLNGVICTKMDLERALSKKEIEEREEAAFRMEAIRLGSLSLAASSAKYRLFKALMVDSNEELASKVQASQDPFSEYADKTTAKELEEIFSEDSTLSGLISQFSVRHTV